MYINPFWAGVSCTLVVEMLCLIIFIMTRVDVVNERDDRKKSENDNN